MVFKIFKAVWFLSLLGWLLSFMYIYASLPEQVMIREGESALLVSKEVLFYLTLATMTLLNGLVFAISRLYKGQESFLAWFYGLITCLNFFFFIVLNFISLVNSSEKYRYSEIGVVIYSSVVLFIVWSIAWPVYSIFRRFLSKQAV